MNERRIPLFLNHNFLDPVGYVVLTFNKEFESVLAKTYDLLDITMACRQDLIHYFNIELSKDSRMKIIAQKSIPQETEVQRKLLELSEKDPVIYIYLNMYRDGKLTWQEMLESLVVFFVQQSRTVSQELRKILEREYGKDH